jgi:hypothetical protein
MGELYERRLDEMAIVDFAQAGAFEIKIWNHSSGPVPHIMSPEMRNCNGQPTPYFRQVQ